MWATQDHVVRLGSVTNHAREARLALAALKSGVRTPRPVAWGEDYGIWERLPGSPPSRGMTVKPRAWQTMLGDLALLHAHPLEDLNEAIASQAWRGRSWLIEATQEAGWTSTDRARLLTVLDEPAVNVPPVFVHGDAYSRNILLNEHGEYVAILDWGCAGWLSLETKCARLEDDALHLACEWWADRLDLQLVWRMRLDLFLEIARDCLNASCTCRNTLGRSSTQLRARREVTRSVPADAACHCSMARCSMRPFRPSRLRLASAAILSDTSMPLVQSQYRPTHLTT